MLAASHPPPANTTPYLSLSCHCLLGAYKQRGCVLSNHCEKVQPYFPSPSNKPERRKEGKRDLTKLHAKVKNDNPIRKVSKLLAAIDLGEKRTKKKKKKILKKLSEGSCQQIKRRLEVISLPFVDVWSHGLSAR